VLPDSTDASVLVLAVAEVDAPPPLHPGSRRELLIGRGKFYTSAVTHRVQEKEGVLGCIQQQAIHYRRGIFAGSQRLVCSRRISQGAASQTAPRCSVQPSKSCRTRLKGCRQREPSTCAEGGEWEGAQEKHQRDLQEGGNEDLLSFFPAAFIILASPKDVIGSSEKMHGRC